MRNRIAMGSLLAALCAGALALSAAPPAGADAPEPDFVFTPSQIFPPPPPKPPIPDFEGPCGIAVDTKGQFYVADYYHHLVDVFSPLPLYLANLPGVGPLDGPCGLALDAAGNLYVNDYHRSVVRYGPSPGFAPGPVFAGAPLDSAHPTGVAVDRATGNVYVDNRTYIAGYDSTGAPLLDEEGDPLKIGAGTLGDGYGLAFSSFPATKGLLYVADAAGNTVKAYNSNPALDIVNPVGAPIEGPTGKDFVSLADSAVAVDDVTGEIYVADNLQPRRTEQPEAVIYLFGAAGVPGGRLKYAIADALPPGLTVDNSGTKSQSRVYVTSGNTIQAVVYAYPPGSATEEEGPPSFSLAMSTAGDGGGAILSDFGEIECATTCSEQVRAAARVRLTAEPDPGSAFVGWSGEGCSGDGACELTVDEAKEVSAGFAELAGPPSPATLGGSGSPAGGASASSATASEIVQKGNVRVTVSGRLSPRRLPRRGVAPISVSVGGRITTTDKSLPPQLKSIRIELNRHGRLDWAGLPVCAYDRIQPGSSVRALEACRASLVGTGRFTANITLAGQEPYPTGGRLLVFNSVKGGKPVLLGHIYSPRPFATSFVIVFSVQKLGRGAYGTAFNSLLPKAMDAWGRLSSLEMTLSRRFTHRGRAHSYISAGCPAPRGLRRAVFALARTSFSFAGGARLTSVLTDTCNVRG
jgi:DNA-binding beta-propeller fold protein YncE